MIIAPSGIALPFEVTYDRTDLIIGMKVWELGLVPTIVYQAIMDHIAVGTYVGYFTADPGKSYLVSKASYEAVDLLVLDEDRSPSSESFLSFDESTTVTITPADVLAIAEGVWELPVLGNNPSDSFGRLLVDTFNSVSSSSANSEFIGAIVGIVADEGVIGIVSDNEAIYGSVE